MEKTSAPLFEVKSTSTVKGIIKQMNEAQQNETFILDDQHNPIAPHVFAFRLQDTLYKLSQLSDEKAQKESMILKILTNEGVPAVNQLRTALLRAILNEQTVRKSKNLAWLTEYQPLLGKIVEQVRSKFK